MVSAWWFVAMTVPALIGVALVMAGRDSRLAGRPVAWWLSFVSSTAVLAGAIGIAITRPVLDVPWISAIDVRFHLGVDGLSLPLLLLTALVGWCAVLVSWRREAGASPATFHGLLQLALVGSLLAFLARDVVLFVIAFDLTLLPVWLLIARYGDPSNPVLRRDAAGRFLIYTVAGSALLLVGALGAVVAAGTSDMDELAAAAGGAMSTTTQIVLACLMVAGLAIKVPVWPVHTWLPPAHTIAPTAGSMLLAAVLLKIGTYGLMRIVVPVVPDGFLRVAPVLAAIAAVGALWAGLICLVEPDLKRLIAWSSVAHMGLVVIAVCTMTEAGLQAAALGNVAHGAVSALLFAVAGALKAQWGHLDLRLPRQPLRDRAPMLAMALVLGCASLAGVPLLATFWPELLTLLAMWDPALAEHKAVMRVLAVVVLCALGVAAAYSIRVVREVWSAPIIKQTMPTREEATATIAAASLHGAAAAAASQAMFPNDLPSRDEEPQPVDAENPRGAEAVGLVVLALGVVALGVAPHVILDLTAGVAETLLSGVSR